jgi:arginine repressor
MSTKTQRQQAISRIIANHSVASQPQLQELLAQDGIKATQATVSATSRNWGP